jgi:hypothetical protein
MGVYTVRSSSITEKTKLIRWIKKSRLFVPDGSAASYSLSSVFASPIVVFLRPSFICMSLAKFRWKISLQLSNRNRYVASRLDWTITPHGVISIRLSLILIIIILIKFDRLHVVNAWYSINTDDYLINKITQLQPVAYATCLQFH